MSSKQKTISSFFQRSSPLSKLPSRPTDTVSDGFKQPPSKRRRLSPADEANEATLDGVEAKESLQPISTNVQRIGPEATATPASQRTSRYLFSTSPQQENEALPEVAESEKQRRNELHNKFVRKLGKPDSLADIKRRNRVLFEEDAEAGEDEEADEDEVLPEPPKKGKSSSKKSGTKLTPMEKQVIEIKQANVDTLLVVEVGYKFRFFGEDARIAAKELGIVCIPGKFRYDDHPSEAHIDRFASASIPVHRLHVHVKRLVAAGHKVGVVRQLETAALKAVGDNRNTPFVRKLTNLYTKGTYIDDIEGVEEAGSPAPPQAPATGFLLCLTEANLKGYGNDEKVHVGLVAVQPATGDIIYDDFEDGFMRSEIETRLLHIAPCEFLLVGELSKATEKLILHLSGTKTNVFGDKARVERIPTQKTTAAQAYGHLSSFYAEKMTASQAVGGKESKMLEKILGLPENVTVCLSSMINHLAEYGLEHIFDLTKYFQPFSARSYMLLNGNTLTSLEIYQNQTDHTVKGSLFWTLDRTHTRFGARLLRKWVGRPLLGDVLISRRLDAVEELMDPENTAKVDKFRRVMTKIGIDLEKSLTRIYYGRCTRPELLKVLQALQLLASEFAFCSTAEKTGFTSPLITDAMVTLPAILNEVVTYLDMINLEAAKSNDKYSFFREEHETEDISEHKLGIASVEHDLEEFRTIAAEKLGKKHPVDYVTVAGIDYLIEVDNGSATIKKVPASWAKISGTKKVSRFHPPDVLRLIRERDQHKESLAASCDAAYKALLTDISTKYQLFRDTIQALSTLDCLLSLAQVAAQPGYTRPNFSSGTHINVQGARHPMIEQLLLDSYVPNDISLTSDTTRALLVTGPNMGGKSSYVRSVALIAIMAQIGSFVPCDFADLGVLDAVFTRMGAFDNMLSGESTFMVELSETSDILKLSTERSLVVLDELGRGTSTHDGVAIAGSVLDWLVREKKCLTLFITHYQVLSRMAEGFEGGELKNVHMRFAEVEGSDNVTFLYEVGEGVAHRSYGLNVARLANVSEEVIELARKKSAELEGRTRGRQLRAVVEMMGREDEQDTLLERIVEGVETL